MPELPDLAVYVEALRRFLVGRRLAGVRLGTPFVLRSVAPPLTAARDRRVVGVERLGKRIVIELEEQVSLAIHLMIAGRLHWKKPGAGLPGRRGLAAFDFDHGTLLLTEAGTRRRASLHVVGSREALRQLDRGGIEVLDCGVEDFRAVLERESHTLKRALTDPRLFSGIGNAYSDEILHRARLSPFQLTTKLEPERTTRLFEAAREVLSEWTDRLRTEAGDGFPEKVTAFREGMAVHGRYRQPCPDCGSPVQRIVYAENEANYCPKCQTGGRLLADRALSRLLGEDWPRTLEELERLPGGGRG